MLGRVSLLCGLLIRRFMWMWVVVLVDLLNGLYSHKSFGDILTEAKSDVYTRGVGVIIR